MGERLRWFRTDSLERRIFFVAAAGLLPLAVLLSITLITAAREQKTRLLEAHSQTVLTLSAAIDSHFENAIASLDAIASSPRLAQGDFAGLRQVAHELLQRRPAWQNVVVSTPDARQVLNARQLLQDPPPESVMPGAVREAARSWRPVVSDLASGEVQQARAFGVHLPVELAGGKRYVITAVLGPASLSDLVKLHPVPDGGVVTIVDRNFRVVARSRDASQWVGSTASGPLRERLQGRESSGIITSRTLDGTDVYSVYHRSGFSGWSAIIGMPRGIIDSPLRWLSFAFAASIVISVLLGLMAAARMGRTIVGPMRELESSAASVGRGEAPQVPQTGLPEVRRVGEALVSAHLERERAMERERDARHVAEHASKAKDEFLAMLGHELRNPLAAISMAARLLERSRDELGAVQASAAAIVSRQVAHLARMTDDLLDAGRIVLGKIALEHARMDLAQAVQAAVATLRSSGQLDHHDVSVQTEPAWIEGDATRIEQVVLNLVTNAIKYTPRGGSIRVEVLCEAREAVLRVSDTGVGLDHELLPRVFDLFVQGKRSIDRSQGGLGVGLTLVRRLAELHGGTAQARSDGPGCGATFTIRLPAVEPLAPHSLPLPMPDGVRPLRIGLVEDNDDVRTGLRHLLELDGHTVHEAADGSAGLELLLATAQLDAALLDVGLPGINGIEIAQAVRRAGRGDLLLVAMTGYGGDQDRQLGIRSGFDAYLVKPVDHEALRRVLLENAGRPADHAREAEQPA
jgi:signal transduction histidine kinase/ActR/RegA family two-component response regulator